MIKSIIFQLLLIVVPLSIQAQPADRNKVKEYYKLKNEAELKIIDSCYREALGLYQQAFGNKFPNPRDLYNAFILAYQLKDTAACKTYYNTLIELGTDKEKLEEMYFIDSIKDDMFYIKDIAWDQEYYYWKYMLSTRPSVARMLDSLYAVDQFYRKYYSREVFFQYDLKNINYLCNYAQQNGFPGFEQAGIKQGQLSTPYNCGAIQLIHWHTRGSDPTASSWAKSFDSVLYEAVLDGRYEPADYALTIDQREQYYYEQLQPIEQMLSEEGLNMNQLPIAAINRRRAQIYLEPLEDYIRKWKFVLTDDNFFFFGPYVSVNNRKTISKMLRHAADNNE